MRRTKDLEDSVKNQGNKLMTFRAFSIGFSAAVLALACGSDSKDGEGGDDPSPVAETPVDTAPAVVERETCADNPLLVGCAATRPEVDINNEPIDPPADNGPPQNRDNPAELARAQAQNILASNCGQCHGPALTPQQASAGMNYIDNIDRLVEEGKIVPLSSASSRIIQRMREGSMPPFATGRTVSDSDIDTVAQFIDNENFWPDVEPQGRDCSDQVFSFDDLYQEIAQDLQRLDEDEQITARYLTLTNRFTAGVCADTSLDRDRNALFKMVNALSTGTTVEKPIPVDAEETIFRIDIGDYNWDQAVTVVNADGSTTDFLDKWEAIAANNAYAVPFVGQDADQAVEDSGTQFPVMLADSFLDAATIGNLYYALIDVDVQDTLDNFILNDLQIDVVQNLEDEEQVRAGTTKSRISRQDRVVQRDDIDIRQGALWQSFDFEDDQNESVFENPFGFAEGGTEAIFTLPNGMFGFIIADENSAIVEDSDILLDTNQNNFRAVTSISCSNCHARGLLPVVDEVRDIALANALTSGLNNDEVEQLRSIYPEPEEFLRVVESDSDRFYRSALAQSDVDLNGGDPVSSVFFRFDQDMKLADAAGDLGLSAESLRINLQLINPALNVLRNGVLDRDDFTQFYIESLCELTVTLENQPDANTCDQALADLRNVRRR
jgi:mono/diheme cytochrome c family protein